MSELILIYKPNTKLPLIILAKTKPLLNQSSDVKYYLNAKKLAVKLLNLMPNILILPGIRLIKLPLSLFVKYLSNITKAQNQNMSFLLILKRYNRI